MNRLIRHRGPDDEGYLLINTKTGAQTHHFHDDSIAEIKRHQHNYLNLQLQI